METLQKCPKGFPNPKLTPINKLKVFDTAFAPTWYNQSIFFKSITDQGYNPFQLNEFQDFEKDTNKIKYLNQSFLHFYKKENQVNIIQFQPNRILASFKTNHTDTLTILQIFNPQWKLKCNNKSLNIVKIQNGLMQVEIPKGEGDIEILYQPLFIKDLLMISIFGYAIILLILIFNFIYSKIIISKSLQVAAQNYR